MKKIWIGHWFTTAFHYIELLKNNPDNQEFEIYCTNSLPHSPLLQIADHAELEPVLEGSEYIDYCLEFCKKHNIEVFIPSYKKLLIISKHYKDFTDIGIKVLNSPDFELMKLINDKAKTYESVRKHNLMATPEYYIVNNFAEFRQAYETLISHGHQVCFKPTNSQGGQGFRIIDNSVNTFKSLFAVPNARVTLERVYSALSTQEHFEDLMVSEYLDGTEYSIDCLGYNGELFAAIPRKKAGGRLRYLENNKDLIELARNFTETYKLPYIYNVQVRFKDGVPKLLEVNPRMSGGIHVSCLSGVNFPYLAVKLLTEGKVDVPEPQFDILASDVEKEIILKRNFE